MKLETGDILSCKKDRLISRIIRFVTRGEYNHTAIYLEIKGEPYIADSQAKGTNLIPLKAWEEKWGYSYTVHRKRKINIAKIKKRALSKVGHTPYDFGALLHHIHFALFNRWRGKRKEDAKDRMYCSEYVAWVFELHNWWKTTPQALFDYLEASDEFENMGYFKAK